MIENLTERIINVLTKMDLDSAIILNGAWGSGKTYFVHNELIPAIENLGEKPKIKTVYISLYGVTELNEISKEIFNKTFLSDKLLFPKLNKKRKVSRGRRKYVWDTIKGTTGSLLKGLLTKKIGFDLVVPEMKEYWNYINESEVILILDDLERSQIDIIELMGYINNFVEEYGIKTLIIGNEEEIKSKFNSHDKILKYLVVKDLELPIEKKEKSPLFSSSNNKTNDKLIKTTFEDLEKNIDYLFSEPTSYDQIKEKLISFTFDYNPDLHNIFEEISKGILTNDKVKEISSLYNKLKYSNIRTFKFSLEMYKLISSIIKNLDIKNKDEILNLFIESVFYSSIVIKAHVEPRYIFSRMDFTTNTILSEGLNEKLKESIRSFLENSILNKVRIEHICIELDQELERYKAEKGYLLEELSVFWLQYEDTILMQKMENTVKKINELPININDYKSLIRYIYLYNEIFPNDQIDIDDILNKMFERIEKEENQIKIGMDFSPNTIDYNDKTSYERINKDIQKIETFVNENNKKKIKKATLGKEESSNWLENLIEIKKDVPLKSFNEKKSLIGHVDVDILIDNINNSTITELNDFYKYILRDIYSFSNINEYYADDLKNLEHLKKGIETIINENNDKKNKYVFTYRLQAILNFINHVIGKLN